MRTGLHPVETMVVIIATMVMGSIILYRRKINRITTEENT